MGIHPQQHKSMSATLIMSMKPHVRQCPANVGQKSYQKLSNATAASSLVDVVCICLFTDVVPLVWSRCNHRGLSLARGKAIVHERAVNNLTVLF